MNKSVPQKSTVKSTNVVTSSSKISSSIPKLMKMSNSNNSKTSNNKDKKAPTEWRDRLSS
jgi:hypothetical protein